MKSPRRGNTHDNGTRDTTYGPGIDSLAGVNRPDSYRADYCPYSTAATQQLPCVLLTHITSRSQFSRVQGRYVGSRPIKLRKSTWRARNIDTVRKKEKEKTALIGLLTGRFVISYSYAKTDDLNHTTVAKLSILCQHNHICRLRKVVYKKSQDRLV
uniref:Uncharacterized protein n=1 Tax=Timema monikensis TaxID=170555 RepID=A0A7R9E9S0_9NEOP|nr:unnamed protein product [Timema monikensis]